MKLLHGPSVEWPTTNTRPSMNLKLSVVLDQFEQGILTPVLEAILRIILATS